MLDERFGVSDGQLMQVSSLDFVNVLQLACHGIDECPIMIFANAPNTLFFCSLPGRFVISPGLVVDVVTTGISSTARRPINRQQTTNNNRQATNRQTDGQDERTRRTGQNRTRQDRRTAQCFVLSEHTSN